MLVYDSVTLGQIHYSKDNEHNKLFFTHTIRNLTARKLGFNKPTCDFKQHTCGFSTNTHVLCTQTGNLLEEFPLGNYFFVTLVSKSPNRVNPSIGNYGS